jgi:hypothetical protein
VTVADLLVPDLEGLGPWGVGWGGGGAVRVMDLSL